MTPNPDEIGVGATDELSLRVSVATLVRVLFKNPNNDELMLALERKATLRRAAEGAAVRVKSQPYGGGIRILDLSTVHDLVDGFHFDSERSRAEQDFRIFIRPSSWSALRDLRPEQYVSKPVTTMVENRAISTENIYAPGTPTVRLYRIYEAIITDLFLPHVMLEHGNDWSHQRLCELAIADAQSGGRGKANAVLTLPWERLQNVYRAMAPAERDVPIVFEENRLDSSVAAILEEIAVPRYQSVY